jgi:hypothetical protein
MTHLSGVPYGLGLHFSDSSIVPCELNQALLKYLKWYQIVFEPRCGQWWTLPGSSWTHAQCFYFLCTSPPTPILLITIFLCKHTPPPNVSFLTNQLYWKCFIETAALGINGEKHNTPLPVPRTMWLSWPPQIVSQMTPYSIYSALLPTRAHRALLKSPVALYIGIRCHLARTLASWGKIKTT